MPIISRFLGISVTMYFYDTQRHQLPHIHVHYQGEEAVFSIPDGNLLEGQIPRKKARLVEAWIELRQQELMADWQLAVQGQPVNPIAPLQ